MTYQQDPQRSIDLYVLTTRPYYISATDYDIMEACNFDPSVAEDELLRWYWRHEDVSSIVGKNPLTLRVYSSSFQDPEQEIIKRNFIKMKKRRYGNGYI